MKTRIGYLLVCSNCGHEENQDMTEREGKKFTDPKTPHPCPTCAREMDIADAAPYYA